MELATTPTTTLEAVNQMLFVIGEPPVNSVEDNGVIYAVTALQTLSAVNREVQKKGWHWNEERNYMLPLSYPAKEVPLPRNCLKVDAVDRRQDIVQRGSRLYDKTRHSYTFEAPVVVDMVVLLDFEEIPEAARNYIFIRAARRFQQGAVGSEQLSNFTLRDEIEAKVDLEDAEADTADLNIFDNISVMEVMAR
jgi:hypothetical protein